MEKTEKKSFEYLEIRKYHGDIVVRRIDVTGKSTNQVCKIDDGININLNHAEYYTKATSSEAKLEEL